MPTQIEGLDGWSLALRLSSQALNAKKGLLFNGAKRHEMFSLFFITAVPFKLPLILPPTCNCQPQYEGLVWVYVCSFPVQLELGSSHYLRQTVSVGEPIKVLTSLLTFSFLPLFNWTLGAQSSAPMCVSASVSISWCMKILFSYPSQAHLLSVIGDSVFLSQLPRHNESHRNNINNITL